MKHPIPNNLRKIATFLRRLEAITPGVRTRENIAISADFLERAAAHYERKEIEMGKTADSINKLEQALASERANSSHLQSQLDAAQANALDSADQAALDGVDGFIANASGDTTAGGAGTDTTAGGAAPAA